MEADTFVGDAASPHVRKRWPKLATWLGRVKAETPLGPLNDLAKALMRAPAKAHCEWLTAFDLGAASRCRAADLARRGPITPP